MKAGGGGGSNPVSATEISHPWMYLNKPSIIFPVLGPSHLCCPLLGPWASLRPLLTGSSPRTVQATPRSRGHPKNRDHRQLMRSAGRCRGCSAEPCSAETGPLRGRSCRWPGLPLSLAGLPGPRAGGRMACAPPPPVPQSGLL
ncbi:hypothetical protein KIL84_011207 [Mauremys mutica]|uniref:Uncharacterized protein n=1 Tax=Mauremys mutica TaxID=74926 RepID=A0A9D3XE38_9SAUR|nr:hypothetical protein KIL84_011207 [Mauremys mutica]